MDQTNLVEEEIQEFLYWETNGIQLDRVLTLLLLKGTLAKSDIQPLYCIAYNGLKERKNDNRGYLDTTFP